jgi:hypothetical protein
VRLPWLPDLEPDTTATSSCARSMPRSAPTAKSSLFHLLAFAARRLGELAALRWEQIDLDHAQTRLAGKLRHVPLHSALEAMLRERRRAARSEHETLVTTSAREPLQPTTLGRSVRALVDRADIEIDCPAHAFRRTAATVMYEHGVRTRVIERIMGWAPCAMHERHYLRIAPEPLHKAIRTLYHDDPSATTNSTPNLPPQPAPSDLSARLAARPHGSTNSTERSRPHADGFPPWKPAHAQGSTRGLRPRRAASSIATSTAQNPWIHAPSRDHVRPPTTRFQRS